MTDVSAQSSLASAQRHARDLQRAGDLNGARVMLEDAVRRGRMTLGPDDPAVLATVHQLATVHRAAGDAAGARRILEDILPVGQRRLGDADPLILGISFDLGRIAEDLDNRHEARRAYGRVAAYGPNVLGDNHWAVRQARAYLGEDPQTVRLTVPDGGVEALRRPAPAVQAPQRRDEAVPRLDEAVPRPDEAVPRPEEAVPRQRAGAPTSPASPGGRPKPGTRRAENTTAPVVPDRMRRRRNPRTVAGTVAGVVVGLGLLVWAVVVLVRPGADDAAAIAGLPPTDVRLSDEGAEVRVQWEDPADGSVPFMVSAGRVGQPLAVHTVTRPGRRTAVVERLDPVADYCFSVGAKYSNGKHAWSPQVCTNRAAANPRASG
jgi:Tetratricopeptide repeat